MGEFGLSDILSAISDNLIQILSTIVTGIIGYLGLRIKNIYQEYIQDKIKKEIVDKTVKYVEQTCKNADGLRRPPLAAANGGAGFHGRKPPASVGGGGLHGRLAGVPVAVADNGLQHAEPADKSRSVARTGH